MSLREFRQKLRQSPPPRAEYMRPSFLRILLFIPIFLIVFPVGAFLGIEYFYFFQKQGITFFLNPLFYFILFGSLLLFVRQFEIRYLWLRVYPEMSGSWYAPFEGPISEIFFVGIIVPIWMGPKEFEPIVEGVTWMLTNLFGG